MFNLTVARERDIEFGDCVYTEVENNEGQTETRMETHENHGNKKNIEHSQVQTQKGIAYPLIWGKGKIDSKMTKYAL